MVNQPNTPEDLKKEIKGLLREMEQAFAEYSNKMGYIWVKIQDLLKKLD
jgi:hypothetical protein